MSYSFKYRLGFVLTLAAVSFICSQPLTRSDRQSPPWTEKDEVQNLLDEVQRLKRQSLEQYLEKRQTPREMWQQ
jgi:hypothetical protein